METRFLDSALQLFFSKYNVCSGTAFEQKIQLKTVKKSPQLTISCELLVNYVRNVRWISCKCRLQYLNQVFDKENRLQL